MREAGIPFNAPPSVGTEAQYVAEAVAAGRTGGGGPFSERCQAWLENELGCARALLTPSCTSALEAAVLLAGIGPGDEVIMPSFTFVSTANAVALRGATPVFADISADTLNIDPEAAEAAVTPATRAIMPVHYGGVACDLDGIGHVAERHDLTVIEDAAHALLARHRGRPLGSVGALGALSFHETKNVTCGEGGALLVNAPELIDRAEIVREMGTNRNRFLRGEVDKYTWVDLGSSHRLSDLNAAFLLAQLEDARELGDRRMSVWSRYHEGFAALEAEGLLRRPIVPAECEHNAHLYYLLLPDRAARDHLLEELRRRGIQATFHYVPLHTAPAGVRFGRAAGPLPVTDDVSGRLARLPMWADLPDAAVERVVTAVDEVARGVRT